MSDAIEAAERAFFVSISTLTSLVSCVCAIAVLYTQYGNYVALRSIKWPFVGIVVSQCIVSLTIATWWLIPSLLVTQSNGVQSNVELGFSFAIRGVVATLSFHTAATVLINWLKASRSHAISRLSAYGAGALYAPGQAEWFGMVLPVAAAAILSPAIGIVSNDDDSRMNWSEGILLLARLVPAGFAVYLPIRYGWPVSAKLRRSKSPELKRAGERMDKLGWFFIAAGVVCIPFYIAVVASGVATLNYLYLAWLGIESGTFLCFVWMVALVLVAPKYLKDFCPVLCCRDKHINELLEGDRSASVNSLNATKSNNILDAPVGAGRRVSTIVANDYAESNMDGGNAYASGAQAVHKTGSNSCSGSYEFPSDGKPVSNKELPAGGQGASSVALYGTKGTSMFLSRAVPSITPQATGSVEFNEHGSMATIAAPAGHPSEIECGRATGSVEFNEHGSMVTIAAPAIHPSEIESGRAGNTANHLQDKSLSLNHGDPGQS